VKTPPIIAWKNLLSEEPDLSVTHSTDEQGHPFANLKDWRDYTLWRSSETGDLYVKIDATEVAGGKVTVDTLAFAGHDMKSAGVAGMTLAWSDDDLDYTAFIGPLTPSRDGVLLRRAAAQTRAYFKLTIPAGYSYAPSIGVLFMGESMVMPTCPDPGFTPDTLVAEASAEYSREGRLLGVSERWKRREVKAGFSRLPPSFVSTTFIPFWKQHGNKPFFFAWDPDDRPEEAALVRLTSSRMEAPYSPAFRSLFLEMAGAGPA